MLLGALIVSHRLAGPLYRLTMHLRDVANGGGFRELKFRKGDYLQEVVGDYNNAMSRLLTAHGPRVTPSAPVPDPQPPSTS